MNENGLAIRAGLGNHRRSNGAARSTTVFDYQRLPEFLRQSIGDGSGNNVR
jgi:hypothetical protein